MLKMSNSPYRMLESGKEVLKWLYIQYPSFAPVRWMCSDINVLTGHQLTS